MITDSIKKSVLSSAMIGNLTFRLKNDSNPKDVLKQIQLTKDELYKNKKITKAQYNVEKNNSEYKYVIPNEWELTQIGNLGYVVGGGTPKTEIQEYWGGEISWITPKDMKKFNMYVDCGDRNITEIGLKNSSAIMLPKDTVLCSSRAPIGYLGIAKNELCTNQGFKSLIPLCGVNPKYVYYYLMARIDDLKKTGDGTTFSEISGTDFAKFYIAFPSLEEQQRIVEIIEKIFEKIEDLKPIEKELYKIKNEFSNNMINSILLNSLSGKLTKQNCDEKIDKILVEIEMHNKIRKINDNIPFIIPDNWKWMYFGDLVDFVIGKTPPRADSSYWSDNEYNWISIADMNDGGHILDTKEYVSQKAFDKIFRGKIVKKGTLIMNFKMSVGKCSILDIDSFHHEGIISIYPKISNPVFKEYLFKVLPFLTNYADIKNAIKGKTMNSKSIDKLLIPIPPIEEQQRIVDKIEQLLPLCDDIEQLVNK